MRRRTTRAARGAVAAAAVVLVALTGCGGDEAGRSDGATTTTTGGSGSGGPAPELVLGSIQWLDAAPEGLPGGRIVYVDLQTQLLRWVATTGGDPVLYPAPEGWTGLGFPAVSPDGRLLAFTAVDAEGREGLFVAAADGSQGIAVDSAGRGLCPSWLPNGRALVVASGAAELPPVQANIDDAPVDLPDLPFSPATCIAVTAGGVLVGEVIDVEAAEVAIWRSGEDAVGTVELFRRRGCDAGGASPSPDGVRIAVVVSCDADRSEDTGLWLVDVATGEAEHLLHQLVGRATWSPDGRWLAVGLHRALADQGPRLALVPLDDPTVAWEVGPALSAYPAWLPDAAG